MAKRWYCLDRETYGSPVCWLIVATLANVAVSFAITFLMHPEIVPPVLEYPEWKTFTKRTEVRPAIAILHTFRDGEQGVALPIDLTTRVFPNGVPSRLTVFIDMGSLDYHSWHAVYLHAEDAPALSQPACCGNGFWSIRDCQPCRLMLCLKSTKRDADAEKAMGMAIRPGGVRVIFLSTP